MKRYFYTDPLAAAWMAKHFGVVIYSGHISANNTWRYADFASGMPEGERWYVHPDSEPLLTPQTDDLLYANIPSFGPGYFVASKCPLSNGGGMPTMAIHFAEDYTTTIKIIERNGIPFMWPQCEDA